jgi:peptidyl-prolyl cis-trans isomerase C
MKSTRLLTITAAGLAVLLSGAFSYAADDAAKSAPTEQPAAVTEVASVNGQKIASDVLDRLMKQAPQGAMAAEATPEAKRALLDKLIEVELVSQEAEKEGVANEPDFKFAMDMLKKQQLYVALIKKKVIDTVKVTPEETKADYDKNKDQYKVGEELKASHILVDTEDDAMKIKERIDKGEAFDAVAKDKSKCPSASRGGDLGYFGKGRMVPEFEKAAFALKDGEVSAPVKTQFGWHIIKVTGRKPASVKSYDDVKGDIEQRLLQDKQKKAYEDMMASLKSAADIKINDTALGKAAEPEKAEPETKGAAKDAPAPAPADNPAEE